MSDGSSTVQAPFGKGLRIVLALSVALNLAVVGMIAGAALHGGGLMRGREGVRELGFGPYTEALSPDQRAALRKALFAKVPELRDARQQMRADMTAILAALRAQPFDAAALATLMQSQRQRMEGQLALGQGLMSDLLIALPEPERLSFADRLEDSLSHKRPGPAAP